MTVGTRIRVPGDKSISHRALILGALANGCSRIRGVLRSADLESTAAVLRALGVPVPSLRDEIFLQGGGLRALRRPEGDLDCANSGTTARLVAGLVSGQPDVGAARFVGDVSLSMRPMRRVADPLTAMGARIELERGDGLPMVVRGAELRSIDWISPVASAQVKSAILLAGLVSGVRVSVHEPILSRDHTERMLAWLGVTMRAEGSVTSLAPVEHLAPFDLTVPADPSSAAFLAARAVLADDGELALVDVCLNPTRTGFFRALHDMGAQVELLEESIEVGEPVGAIRARPSELMGIEVRAAEVASMIDELPLLACVASRACGTTRISGAAELRSKESDRIRSVVANLRALGADADERTDGFDVEGSNRPLRGSVRTNGDHRIAMAFGVLAALPGNDITIDDRDCVSISYPGFWRDLRRAATSDSRIPTTDYRLPTTEQ